MMHSSVERLLRQALLLVAASLVAAPDRASAIIISTYDGPSTPVNPTGVAPADDPGFANAADNFSAVYLGNQWVLSATHQTMGDVTLDGVEYEVVPGSSVVLSNPSTFSGRVLSNNSDLRLFRINTNDAGLPPELASSAIKDISFATSTPSADQEVLMIGRGHGRQLKTSDPNGQWHFIKSGGTWTAVGLDNSPAPTHHGFIRGNRRKSWGTNAIITPSATRLTNKITDADNVLLRFDGFNDVIGYAVEFDRGLNNAGDPIDDGALMYEAQGQFGDSGGPVFTKENGEWVLAGLIHGIVTENDQPGNVSFFGNQTLLSDISQPHYRTQLEALLASNVYSQMGDVDLDGVIDASIVDGEAQGDLSPIVDNWLSTHAEPGVVSWKAGDLNQDGITDISDFLLLRDAAGGSIDVQGFASLVDGLVVPEPATVTTLVALACWSPRRRR